MNPYKKLGGQAIVYGLGNIIPRLLNYAVLTVYYTRKFPAEKYGVITELYAYVAIFLVILTYGMETGLFKFSSEKSSKGIVFTTALGSIITTSVAFALLVFVFRDNISQWIGYSGNPEYIVYLGLTLSLDAVSAIIFAKLRIDNKVRRFAIVKILNVVTTVVFVFLFLELIPRMEWITNSHFYITRMKDTEVGYIFIANLIASFIVLLLLLPEFTNIKFVYDRVLLKKILIYSIPLLISGLAGIFNETIDRILLRHFSAENLDSLYEIGIYGANYRIAVLMTIFVQMFRYAAEPFFFNFSRNSDSKMVYANVLKYFTIFLMIIFLGVALCIDFFKLFIDSDYYEGLSIVPIVLMANVLVGILFNLNMWYKLSGHTIYGVYITGIGALLTVLLNIAFIPRYGYIACAWIHLMSNLIMILLTYISGQKIFKINYDLKKIGSYIGIALLLFVVGSLVRTSMPVINVLTGIILVIVYFLYCNKKEDLIHIFLKKNEG